MSKCKLPLTELSDRTTQTSKRGRNLKIAHFEFRFVLKLTKELDMNRSDRINFYVSLEFQEACR